MHMTTPLLALLGFAVWTLGLLAATVGVHRWTQIIFKRAAVNSFPADAPSGPGWYQRATRAHLNCIENLPVFGAIVFVIEAVGRRSWLIDVLSVAILAARICQTTTHVGFVQTSRAVSIRFTFFTVQLISMLWLAVLAVK